MVSTRIRKLASNIVEVPHNHFPVKLEPAKGKAFKGYVDFQGLQIDIENPKGSIRSKTAPDGKKWEVLMHSHYGEIRGTEGVDGDKLDVYVGDNHDSSLVVVIHQQRPDTGEYDEDKIMVGYDNVEEAVGMYKKQYGKPGFYGGHTAMPIGQFWRWVNDERKRGKKVTGAAKAPKKPDLTKLKGDFLGHFEERDAIGMGKTTLSKSDMEEVAWEMGYENESYDYHLKKYEPLAKSLGANLRGEYDRGRKESEG